VPCLETEGAATIERGRGVPWNRSMKASYDLMAWTARASSSRCATAVIVVATG
jgi:hypothetical protein